jgi:hypothetical protein
MFPCFQDSVPRRILGIPSLAEAGNTEVVQPSLIQRDKVGEGAAVAALCLGDQVGCDGI